MRLQAMRAQAMQVFTLALHMVPGGVSKVARLQAMSEHRKVIHL